MRYQTDSKGFLSRERSPRGARRWHSLALHARAAVASWRGSSPRAADVIVGCVAENTPQMLGGALRLVRSIRWFGGTLSGSRVLVCVVGAVDAAWAVAFAEWGAEIREVERLDARSPFANKLQFFTAAEGMGAAFHLLLDCDALVVADPLPALPVGAFSAATADVPSVTHEVFERVFAHFELPIPARSATTTLLAEKTIPYFNSGVVFLPAALGRVLLPLWRDYSSRLLADPSLLGPCGKHANQAALAIALVAARIPVRRAPSALNLPLHMTHLPRSAEFLATEPRILHYHERVGDDGCLHTTGWPRVDAHILRFNQRQREAEGLPAPPRLIAVHHRLAGRTGHRFNEGLSLVDEASRRGRSLVLLIHRDAEPEVRAALPGARAVLHDPVFRADLGFRERVREFVAMLHAHVDPELSGHDLILMTVATQCEAAAFAEWMSELGDPGPRVVLYFHSDRWNRSEDDERRRQLDELAIAKASIQSLPAAVGARLRIGAGTAALAAHLTDLLGVVVTEAPLPLGFDRRPSARRSGVDGSGVRLGFLGGAREEKGFDRLPAILGALRSRLTFRALVQLANETLPPAAWADLEALADQPEVEALRGALSPQQWSAAIDACEFLVLPYSRVPYRQRTSGIFVEAAAAGIPSVVPDGIWMAEKIAAGDAAGVVYTGDTPEAIAAACAEASARLPELQERAAAAAGAWQRAGGWTALLAWSESKL